MAREFFAQGEQDFVPLPDLDAAFSERPENGTVPVGGAPSTDPTIFDFLERMVEADATDLHIKEGSPPVVRVDGDLHRIAPEKLSDAQTRTLVRQLLTPEQFQRFEEEQDLDLGYTLPGKARLRVNVLFQRGHMGLAIRRIPEKVPTITQLRISPVCGILAEKPRGLVLVTGPTGSGKSTTLAAMIHHINQTRACHILTMEDPIEYIHRDFNAFITQREVGRDTQTFATALRRALRQDPDVILVGEMRDLETVSLAVTAAETGHLVFATLHTTSAVLSVDRIVDVFPPNQQQQIRMQLADSLQGIISQTLLPRISGGVAVAQEILVATDAIRALIREGKTPQIGNIMQTSGKQGMTTLESALNQLIARRVISYETALSKANSPKQILEDGVTRKTSRR